MNNSWHTNFKASQEGILTFKYSLRTHNQFEYLTAYKFGIESSQPLYIIYEESTIKKYSPTIKLDSTSSLVVTMLKPSKDKNNLMVRIFNPTDKTGSSYIRWEGMNKPLFFLSNGDEEEKEQIENKIALSPFEAVTLKIREK
jgi:alpha-mannosidase